MADAEPDEVNVTVSNPGVRTTVVVKFALASLCMVVVPTALFFASMHGYLDGVQLSQQLLA